jgi:hypothetical protein
MFGNKPARILSAEERQNACILAQRRKELRDEDVFLRTLVMIERDAVLVGLMHDLIKELGERLTLLRLEEMAF